MELEERTIEDLVDRCESCGTPLTDAEKQAILEAETRPALCTTCAAEQVPLEDEVEPEEL
jgi:hypothetical protein